MEDKGSLIFYIILAIIAIAGSFQGRKKKAPAGKPKPSGMTLPGKPEQTPASQARSAEPARSAGQARIPRYETPEPSMEGSFESPVAGTFSSEGSFSRSMADDFTAEGSIEDTLAAAFASEGISSLSYAHIRTPGDSAIEDGEIQDLPEYVYSESVADDVLAEGFNLRRAVIYSAILNRKEYSF